MYTLMHAILHDRHSEWVMQLCHPRAGTTNLHRKLIHNGLQNKFRAYEFRGGRSSCRALHSYKLAGRPRRRCTRGTMIVDRIANDSSN